ncbi:MAG: entericidin A/B family lipoprotein [Aeromonas sp.]
MNKCQNLLVLCACLLLLGCNTIHGMGRDVEKAGEVIQNSSKLADEAAR